jgi:protein O-mannosyl-transferase
MSRPRVISLVLALITLLVYLPVTHHAFLNYDDGDYVTENQAVQNGLTWAGIQWAFTSWHVNNWHPVTWLSHMTDYEIFRLNPGGHHFVNVLFHTANAVLLFTLLWQLTAALWPSALVAALFAWHPLHVESVAWISERKDVLSTFFALLTLLFYTGYARENRRNFFWLALVFFALGLMSKPMLVTLPLVMLLLDYWPLQRMEQTKIMGLASEKWPFFLLTAVSCVVTFLAQRNEAVASLQKVSLGSRFENALAAYPWYLQKMIWPVDLAVFYPLPKHISGIHLATAAVILIFISVFAWRTSRQNPCLLMGWLWFLGTLVPVIGLVQVGDQATADRYSYFPLIGIFIAIVFGLAKWSDPFRIPKIVLAGSGVLILAACLALTKNQLPYWRDSESLFIHALAVTKDNALAHLNLGAAFEADEKSEAALTQYHEALRLDPQNYEADNNIGKLLYEMNQPQAALDYCLKAVQLNPKRAQLHNNLGIVLAELNRFDEARGQFSEAMQLDVNYAPPHFQTGKTLLKQGRDAEAMPHLLAALKIEPDDYQMLIYVARVLAADENPQIRSGTEALALAARADQLLGHAQPVGLDTLAMACAEAGRFDEAQQLEQQALQLAPAAGPSDDAPLMQHRLQLYKNHQPWRETFQKK